MEMHHLCWFLFKKTMAFVSYALIKNKKLQSILNT